MNAMTMLACGPGPEILYFVCAVYGAVAVALGLFVWGAIALGRGRIPLGVALVSISALLAAPLLRLFRIL